jgi:hypothetical protein
MTKLNHHAKTIVGWCGHHLLAEFWLWGFLQKNLIRLPFTPPQVTSLGPSEIDIVVDRGIHLI